MIVTSPQQDQSLEWKNGTAKEITFIVTKDCQLACKYCYLVGKGNYGRMSWETAKAVVDYILSNENDSYFNQESVIFDFIGGEPFLEIDLIDTICDYIKLQMYLRRHHWFDSYRFSITTNGINYDSPKVQRFIEKNREHLSITITIDGTQEKHDINRIWRNATDSDAEEHGSYNDVVRNVPLWLKQFPDASTKVTISSADIPYICESVQHLFQLGIRSVYINCVFENVWNEGDDLVFEKQLKQLADAMISNGWYKNRMCSFFDRSIGLPMDSGYEDRNWCGAGKALAVDSTGSFYPCVRFVQYSLRNKATRTIGNITNGLDKDRIRPFDLLRRSVQSSKECIECPVASGCAWCQGENYDSADTDTIYQRSTAICKMHKARVRANGYYWEKLAETETSMKPLQKKPVNNVCTLDKQETSPTSIVVLLDETSVAYCVADNTNKKPHLIPLEYLKRIIGQATEEDLELQFVYPDYDLPQEYKALISNVDAKKITPRGYNGDAIVINGWREKLEGKYCVLRTTIDDFCKYINKLYESLEKVTRLDFVFTDEQNLSDAHFDKYAKALEILSDIILECWELGHHVNVNIITDRLYLHDMQNCDAGWKSITLAPNGHYYVCPSFYYANPADNIGSLDAGLQIKNGLLYHLDHAPLCADCKSYHCQRCVWLNRMKTLEVNTPSFGQCQKSRIEHQASINFYNRWKERQR